MSKYETMFIVRPELSEEERKSLVEQLKDAVIKHKGTVSAIDLWSEKKKLYFPINKHTEGVYYLMNFEVDTLAIKDIKHIYKLNENILRVLITAL